jgi:hypothetical protein
MSDENLIKKKQGSTNRRKGQNAERSIASELRELGWKDAATTRASSRMLDNAKVDINFVPFNIQSKAVKRNLNTKNYSDLIDEVNKGVAALPVDYLHRLTYPTIVFHKKDRQTLCIMTKEDFYTILRNYNIKKH